MENRWVKILLACSISLLMIKGGVSATIYLWPKPAVDTTGSAASQELIRLTNEYRRSLGLGELIVNPRLTQAAVNKAKDILAKQYFNHSSPSGRKFSDWVKEVNYAYFYVGENLAIDFATPQEVFDAWLKSPKHKENIDRKEFQEIGLANIKGRFDGRETDVVVQMFGSRVLGANEQSAGETGSPLAANYFLPSGGFGSADGLGLIDSWLNYILFAAILLLVLSVIIVRRRQKKLPAGNLRHRADKTVSNDIKPEPRINVRKISATKQAPPLVSLYTKRTLTAYDRPDTSRKTSPLNSRKTATTRTPKAKRPS